MKKMKKALIVFVISAVLLAIVILVIYFSPTNSIEEVMAPLQAEEKAGDGGDSAEENAGDGIDSTEALLLPQLKVDESVSLSVDSDLQIMADYEGYGILSYESYDEDVVTVSDGGMLTGVHPGEADVAVRLDSDGKYRAWSENVHVTVTAPDISKTIFLTYDDGPSGNITPQLLDTLKAYDAHATFFIIGTFAESHPEIVKRAYDEGHTIAIHTYTHDYRKIYASREAYIEDFDKTEALIEEITGQKPRFWRFPGGSNNGYTNHASQYVIMDELKARGYTPMDWNVSTTDAAPDYPSAATMVEKGSEYIDQAIASDRVPVVLMHDSEKKVNACEATKTFIEKYGALGYDFRGLDDYYGEGITFLD